MKTKLILAILFAVLVISCKNENKQSTDEVQANTFKVIVSVISKEDDDFCLLYTQDGSINFKDEVIWQHADGKAEAQEVVFNFPENDYPTQLRFDLGFKKNQDDFIIKSVELQYNGKLKVISGTELGNFFRADDSKCTFDVATGLIKPIIINNIKQVPSLYPQETNLGPEIIKLAK